MSRGGSGAQSGNFNRGGSGAQSGSFNRGGSGNFRGGGRFNGGRFYGGRGFYYGGFYPYYAFGFGYPYAYYGYPYGYAYPSYGYGYGYPAYGYDQQGVYNGRVADPRNRNSQERDPKDQSSVEARVQERLARSGYYHGEIDGIVGDSTRRAIRSYERANGLRVDGRIDDRLLSTMGLG